MHSAFSFPFECVYLQKVYKKVQFGVPDEYKTLVHGESFTKLSEEERTFLIAKDPADFETYNAFDEPDLIPSLVRLVERVNAGANKRESVKKWVEKWGFLDATYLFPNKIDFDLTDLRTLAERNVLYDPLLSPIIARRERAFMNLRKFWEIATIFVRLWRMYQQITNRQLDDLKQWIRFEPKEIDRDHRWVDVDIEGKPFTIITNSFAEIERNPLYYYQAAGFQYIIRAVSGSTRGLIFDTAEVKIDTMRDQDFFKVTPVLKAETLSQALYVMFYLLLCENTKKICINCGKPFPPNRRNQQYCSETCSNTSKSRRHRQRKIQGLNII
ncbi:hypothetical protein ACPT9H_18190 [Brevibacillus borstelensis]|uniref:hypothetical protein n=1 Tax=Brevibacillus borstelensis TaxID=45462 RepID=UPI003CE4E6A3